VELYDDDVRAILQLLDATTFDELEVETDRFRLTLRREGAAWTRETRTLGGPREAHTASQAPTAARDPGDARDDSPAPGAAGWIAVKTPLPGTFYRSPKPGAPPFVEVGASVQPDTVVAIVETMKLMNSIYAGTRGRIAAISRADAELVRQHSVLMFVEPDAA
jgi:acetyl-CoA carboxylase biotin carboxyl carrier protein